MIKKLSARRAQRSILAGSPRESVSTDRLFRFLTTGPMERITAHETEGIVDWMDPNQDAQAFHDWIMGAAIGWVSDPATRDHWRQFPGIKLDEVDWHALSDRLRANFGWPVLRQPITKPGDPPPPEGEQREDGGSKEREAAARRYYHGTPSRNAESIKRNGLRAPVYLATTPDEAEAFANLDAGIGEGVVVFEVLVPDAALLERDELADADENHAGKGSVVYNGNIPPQSIVREAAARSAASCGKSAGWHRAGRCSDPHCVENIAARGERRAGDEHLTPNVRHWPVDDGELWALVTPDFDPQTVDQNFYATGTWDTPLPKGMFSYMLITGNVAGLAATDPSVRGQGLMQKLILAALQEHDHLVMEDTEPGMRSLLNRMLSDGLIQEHEGEMRRFDSGNDLVIRLASKKNTAGERQRPLISKWRARIAGRIEDAPPVQVGKDYWFEYHCDESDQSADVHLRNRSRDRVRVMKLESADDPDNRVFEVQFSDGFIAHVFEDELLESEDQYQRPEELIDRTGPIYPQQRAPSQPDQEPGQGLGGTASMRSLFAARRKRRQNVRSAPPDSGCEEIGGLSAQADAYDPKKKEKRVQRRSPSEVLALAGFNDPQMRINDLWSAFTKSGARERHDHAITSVHLTGSRWKGDERPDSDLDVVVYHNGNALMSEANQAFRARVAEITGGVVDAFLLPQTESWDHPMSGNIMTLTASATPKFFRAGERQRSAAGQVPDDRSDLQRMADDLFDFLSVNPQADHNKMIRFIASKWGAHPADMESPVWNALNYLMEDERRVKWSDADRRWIVKHDTDDRQFQFLVSNIVHIVEGELKKENSWRLGELLAAVARAWPEADKEFVSQAFEHAIKWMQQQGKIEWSDGIVRTTSPRPEAPDTPAQVETLNPVQRQTRIDALLDRWNKEPESRPQIEEQLKSLRAFSALFTLRLAGFNGDALSDMAKIKKLMKQYWDGRVAEDWAGGLECSQDSDGLDDLLRANGITNAVHVSGYYIPNEKEKQHLGSFYAPEMSHDWLELNGLILDITHSQFGAPDYLIAQVGDPRYVSAEEGERREIERRKNTGGERQSLLRSWLERRAEGADPAAGPFKAPWPDQIQAFMQAVYDQTEGHPFTRGQRIWNGSVIFEVHPWAGGPDPEYPWVITLKWLQSMEPGHGNARACLQWLNGLADEFGVPLDLHAKPTGEPKIPKPALKKLYKDEGFERDRGQGPDDMVRHPKLSALWRARRAQAETEIGKITYRGREVPVVVPTKDLDQWLKLRTDDRIVHDPALGKQFTELVGRLHEYAALKIEPNANIRESMNISLYPDIERALDYFGYGRDEAQHKLQEQGGEDRLKEAAFSMFEQYRLDQMNPQQAADMLMNMAVVLHKDMGMTMDEAKSRLSSLLIEWGGGGPENLHLNSLRGRWTLRRAMKSGEQKLLRELKCTVIGADTGTVNEAVLPAGTVVGVQPHSNDHMIFFYSPLYSRMIVRGKVMRSNQYAAPVQEFRAATDIGYGEGTGYEHGPECHCEECMAKDDLTTRRCPSCGSRECPGDGDSIDCRKPGSMTLKDVPVETRDSLLDKFNRGEIDEPTLRRRMKQLGSTLLSRWRRRAEIKPDGSIDWDVVEALCEQARALLIETNPDSDYRPLSACGMSSSALANELLKLGLPVEEVWGVFIMERPGYHGGYDQCGSDCFEAEHVWLEVAGKIIDISADQFNEWVDGAPYPPVYIGTNDGRWVERSRKPAQKWKLDAASRFRARRAESQAQLINEVLGQITEGEIAGSGIANKVTDFVWSRTRIDPKKTNMGADGVNETAAWLDQEEADYFSDMGEARVRGGDEAKRQAIENEPVVVIQGDDGVLWVLDGNHRTAQSIVWGIDSIPALLGVKKPGVGRTPVNPDYKLGSLLERWFTRRANDPLKKIIEINGVKVGIEWPKGSTRTWKHLPGNDYEKLMKADYGYIRQTEGEDGEEIDVYAGPKRDSDLAFVVTQLDKKTGEYDEDKIMLGYGSEAEAKASYLEHMEKAHFGGIKKLEWDEFLKMVPKSQRVKEKTAASRYPLLFKFQAGKDYYGVTEDGNILRMDMPEMGPSGQWRLEGVQSVNGEFRSFDWLKQIFTSKPWAVPNLQGWSIVDFDHGTRRIWGQQINNFWVMNEQPTGEPMRSTKKPPRVEQSIPDWYQQIEDMIIDLLRKGPSTISKDLSEFPGIDPRMADEVSLIIGKLLDRGVIMFDGGTAEFSLLQEPTEPKTVDEVPEMGRGDMQSKIDALLDQLALEKDPKKKKQIEQRIRSLSAGTKEVWRRRAGDTQMISEQRSPGAVKECSHHWPGKKPGERGWCGRCEL